MNYIKEIKEITAQLSDIITKASDTLWEYSETYFEEFKSSKYLENIATQEGFLVENPLADLPTAFVASFGKGDITVGFLAEYDALPGLSQEKNIPYKSPVEGKSQSDSGHGCGHNCLGAGSLGAAIAFKNYCVKNNISVTIKLFGCPAEENGSGKMFMARDGIFDGVDFCISWHPSNSNEISGKSSLACLSAKFTFHGVTSHAAATPHLGRSALDACELMNVGVNYLREHIIPEARVHYSYLEVGGKAPNVVQDLASTYYFIRAPKVYQAFEIAERIYNIANGAALMTQTTVDIEKLDGLCEYIPNKTLGTAASKVYKLVGAPVWTEDDKALAEEYSKTFDKNQVNIEKQLMAAENNVEIELYDGISLDNLVAEYKHSPLSVSPGSTDVGDVSFCCPVIEIRTATCAIGTPGHSWQMTGQSASVIAHKGTITAATVMAAVAANVCNDNQLIVAAKNEHTVAVPNGYICPAPKDLKPTVS